MIFVTATYKEIKSKITMKNLTAWRWHSGLEHSPCKPKVWCSNPSRDRVSQVLGDDHYKLMPHVTVGVAS